MAEAKGRTFTWVSRLTPPPTPSPPSSFPPSPPSPPSLPPTAAGYLVTTTTTTTTTTTVVPFVPANSLGAHECLGAAVRLQAVLRRRQGAREATVRSAEREDARRVYEAAVHLQSAQRARVARVALTGILQSRAVHLTATRLQAAERRRRIRSSMACDLLGRGAGHRLSTERAAAPAAPSVNHTPRKAQQQVQQVQQVQQAQQAQQVQQMQQDHCSHHAQRAQLMRGKRAATAELGYEGGRTASAHQQPNERSAPPLPPRFATSTGLRLLKHVPRILPRPAPAAGSRQAKPFDPEAARRNAKRHWKALADKHTSSASRLAQVTLHTYAYIYTHIHTYTYTYTSTPRPPLG